MCGKRRIIIIKKEKGKRGTNFSHKKNEKTFGTFEYEMNTMTDHFSHR